MKPDAYMNICPWILRCFIYEIKITNITIPFHAEYVASVIEPVCLEFPSRCTVTVLGREEGYTVSVLGRDKVYTVKYNPCLKEFPRAKPKGAPEGKGLYLTVYPELSPNTDII